MDTQESEEVILLFQTYSLDSQRLHVSFKQAGCDHIAVVIEDDGFLPEDVMSVYGYFIKDYRWKTGENRGKSFSEVMTPDCWKLENNEEYEHHRAKGKLFYVGNPESRRVKTVKWYDERNVIRSSDHYNQYGAMYARTIYNAQGQGIEKSWFSPEGRETIVEDLLTGGITLYEKNEVKKFQEKQEFAVYFFIKTGFWRRRIFFNSLDIPFLVSNRLKPSGKKDVLFWQEPVGNEIPGNMRMILEERAGRAAEIVVQKRCSYERLLELGAAADKMHKLGFIYRFQKGNGHQAEALICTNSDQVEHCKEIVEALPRMHFHIAAVTAMSEKLLSMREYENVSLYPGAGMAVLKELFRKCDYYLDINHYGEIVSAVYRAFLHNHMIFAFEETAHNRNYVAERWTYPIKEWERMVEDIRVIMEDTELLDRCIERQHEEAFAENRRTFRTGVEKVKSRKPGIRD